MAVSWDSRTTQFVWALLWHHSTVWPRGGQLAHHTVRKLQNLCAWKFPGMFKIDIWSSRKPPNLVREARSSAWEHESKKNDGSMGGREGSRDSLCDSERGILTCSNPFLPSASHSKHSARPCQPSASAALPQGLVPKGSTCFEPTGAWAASPALPHPSISVQGSSAPSQKFCPILSKGAPNKLHFAASARNGFQLSILKYLWLTVQEQWHAGNMICFRAP